MKRFILGILISFVMINVSFADYTSPGTGRNWNLDSLVANSSGAVTFSSGIYSVNANINVLPIDTFRTPGTGISWNLDSLVVNSSGAVTFSGDAYNLLKNIIISDSDTLKILSNVTVKFDSAKFLNIHGVLLLNPPDSVKFTAIDTNKMYAGMRFDTSSASVVKKLIMEYANSIRLYGSNLIIDNCTFRKNIYYTSSLASGTVYLYGSNPVISNCLFTGGYRAAINSGANIPSSPTIINNIFRDNNVSNYNTPQINMGAGGTQPIIIRGNTFLRASTNSGAIAFSPIGGTVPYLIIENNIIKNNRYGIAISGGVTAYINNNVIDSNNIQGAPMSGGSGLNFGGAWSTSSVICTRNKIRWNLWGVSIQNTAKPNLGNLSSPDTTDVGLNLIYGNGNSGKIFDMYNNTPDSIKAQNNYWNTTNLDTIEAHIIHKVDSTFLGVIDFLPIAGPSGIVNNPVVAKSYEFLDVYPNPFNPEVTIKFRIMNDGMTRIRIYDLLGREVYTVANEFMRAGEYERNWISRGLPSSVYIVRLETSGNSYAKRIAIVK
ncbi:MAG: T9SS type A sorting domain-containing protein [Bacteroidetes bacterium]|nr:T9SS type A sorting domain-containing protein [Bacteroidota bacterium]